MASNEKGSPSGEPGGLKFDGNKLRMDLISVPVLRGLAEVLTFGAQKYSARNWEKGIVFSRTYAAALRHLTAWWAGEDLDPETGLSHVKHALCNLHFLVHFIESQQRWLDDRPHQPVSGASQEHTGRDLFAIEQCSKGEVARLLSEAGSVLAAPLTPVVPTAPGTDEGSHDAQGVVGFTQASVVPVKSLLKPWERDWTQNRSEPSPSDRVCADPNCIPCSSRGPLAALQAKEGFDVIDRAPRLESNQPAK